MPSRIASQIQIVFVINIDFFFFVIPIKKREKVFSNVFYESHVLI
jgi:hypothetical protein